MAGGRAIGTIRRLASPCAVRQGELWLSGACAEAALEPDILEAMMPRLYAPEVRGASTNSLQPSVRVRARRRTEDVRRQRCRRSAQTIGTPPDSRHLQRVEMVRGLTP